MNARESLALAPTMRAYISETTPRALFVAAYRELASACRAIERPGLAVAAVSDSGQLLGAGAVIGATTAVPILVGDHDGCDLAIHHPAVALRELAIVVEPGHGGYRVIDLRRDGDLADETGRAVRALRSDGVAIVRTAAYTLFLLPLGEPRAWPDSAEHAWAMLPHRVYREERHSTPPPHHLLTSVALRTRGPRFSLEDLAGDDHAGTLELTQDHRRVTLAVGARALTEGIVIGRNDQLSDPTLSRAHALLIHAGTELVAIDLASTFGTGRPGNIAARMCRLGCDGELWLGHSTRLRWRAAVIA